MANIKDRLNEDRVKFLKARDELNLSVVRALIGTIETAEKGGKKAVTFDDAQVLEVLGREQKKRRESAEIYANAGNAERSERETAEADVISRYLPVQLTETEIREIATVAANEAGDDANFGQVMKLVTAQTKGRADGKLVSGIVREVLA